MRQFLYIKKFYKYLMFLLRERERERESIIRAPLSYVIIRQVTSF